MYAHDGSDPGPRPAPERAWDRAARPSGLRSGRSPRRPADRFAPSRLSLPEAALRRGLARSTESSPGASKTSFSNAGATYLRACARAACGLSRNSPDICRRAIHGHLHAEVRASRDQVVTQAPWPSPVVRRSPVDVSPFVRASGVHPLAARGGRSCRFCRFFRSIGVLVRIP